MKPRSQNTGVVLLAEFSDRAIVLESEPKKAAAKAKKAASTRQGGKGRRGAKDNDARKNR